MKTKTITTSVLAAAAIAIGITTIVLINQPTKEQPKQVEQSQVIKAEVSNESLVSFTGEANKNVLDQLKTKAVVEIKDSSYGPYVDTVNGSVGGTDDKYWSFYVDGELAQVGAGEYITKGGEKIEWKFE